MSHSFRNRTAYISLIFVVLLTACTSVSPTGVPASTEISATPLMVALATITPTRVMQAGIWDDLLKATPFPHKFQLPDPVQSSIDGTYAKVDQSPPQYWTCYRCADYRPEGGIWKLQFDKGVMRILYQITNWKSIASFTVDGDRLKIFNDPFCPQDVGEYEWAMENGNLLLRAIEDGCAFDLRKENLAKQSWLDCSAEGQNQQGCAEIPDSPPGDGPAQLPVTVNVLGGDSHYFDKPPDTFAVANKENVPSPDGIQIQYHDESIPFGTHRVLWWKGDWIEATTDLPFTSIGVQFWGSGYLGWGRILFDGVEVWRGLTTSLGKQHAYYGGYIEIVGFGPGPHTIRVEDLGFDYRPIKVAAFGFSNQNVEAKSP